jgi:hypothetical protein
MAEKKIIAVLGATGAQGGGLARAILNDATGGFAVRALTRDINSDKAKELGKLGAEVVAADVDNVESLKKAFKGAYGIFKRGREFIGKTVGVAGEHVTGAQMANTLTKVLGREVRYNAVSPEVYRGFGFPGAEDLGNMFQCKRDFEQYYCGVRNLEVSRSLNPSLQTFEQWLKKNDNRIPLE